MTDLKLDPRTTALVLIDLQKGVVARSTSPHTAADVAARSARLADRFREAGAAVVLVHVAFATDRSDPLQQTVDAPNPVATPPRDWSDFVPQIGPRNGDIIITKRQWGAFYGTDLDLYCGGAACERSCCAESRRTSASSRPRATHGSATTRSCSSKTR